MVVGRIVEMGTVLAGVVVGGAVVAKTAYQGDHDKERDKEKERDKCMSSWIYRSSFHQSHRHNQNLGRKRIHQQYMFQLKHIGIRYLYISQLLQKNNVS